MIRKLASSFFVFAAAIMVSGAFAQTRQLTSSQPGWPLSQNTEKPWTRWWWPGSAVDKESLTHQLEQFAQAGLGGVEITPIYGAKGYESRYIDFLSPRFMEMLEHVGREAHRLGLGVDMATGTGWPFGGPWVTEFDANTKIALVNGSLGGEPTKMMVKRAAPGDEGLVLDPYSSDALRRYLNKFDDAFASFPRGLIRGQFHDSFEDYNASWSPSLPEVFQQMHGYDIQKFAVALMGKETLDADTLGRVKSDYRATLARMHLDYLRTWVAWSHEHGFIARNQSHGAPANLLDLYANADVPETEVFGSTPFPIPGLRRFEDEVRGDQDLPEALVIRMASSAAHVMGHPLASSETCTWLREHWKVALSYTKPEIDRLFAEGINHIFYHGSVFSPQDAPWPGWLFYASTQFNPNNTWWDDFGALNGYVERVQSVLQRGAPDNDVLLYWPVHDLWDDTDGMMKQFTVHSVGFLLNQPVGKLARSLADDGYTFDYISDAQLAITRRSGRGFAVPGGHYRLLVVPTTRRMPLETLRHIVEMAREGASIVFQALPEDVPGLGHLDERRTEFQALIAQLKTISEKNPARVIIGDGELSQGDQLSGFALAGVHREPIADSGVSFIRRANATGHDYFFANLTATKLEGWVTLGSTTRSATILDPLTGRVGDAAVRPGAGGLARIFLQIEPGESLIVRTLADGDAAAPAWTYLAPAGEPFVVKGEWWNQFIKGGPKLPDTLGTTELKSWTELGDDEAQRFGGTARYTTWFELPAQKADEWILDLGDVRESARVRLNGRDVTTAWSLPFRVRVGEFLKPGANTIELEVTNLAANRIRDMDRRGVPWKIMREINFVNVRYQPFDASKWAVKESGLLGPVRLLPMHAIDTAKAK